VLFPKMPRDEPDRTFKPGVGDQPGQGWVAQNHQSGKPMS